MKLTYLDGKQIQNIKERKRFIDISHRYNQNSSSQLTRYPVPLDGIVELNFVPPKDAYMLWIEVTTVAFDSESVLTTQF